MVAIKFAQQTAALACAALAYSPAAAQPAIKWPDVVWAEQPLPVAHPLGVRVFRDGRCLDVYRGTTRETSIIGNLFRTTDLIERSRRYPDAVVRSLTCEQDAAASTRNYLTIHVDRPAPIPTGYRRFRRGFDPGLACALGLKLEGGRVRRLVLNVGRAGQRIDFTKDRAAIGCVGGAMLAQLGFVEPFKSARDGTLTQDHIWGFQDVMNIMIPQNVEWYLNSRPGDSI